LFYIAAGTSDILNSPLNYGTPTSVSTPRTGQASATPIRRRNDIDFDANIRQREINVQPVCVKNRNIDLI
jgi:hypothetical protein